MGGWSVSEESEARRELCFQGWTIDASLIHDAGFVENIAFAKLILKRPAYLGRDNQPDLSENNPSFYSFTSFFCTVFFHFFSFFVFFFFSFSTFFLRLSSLCFLSSLCVCCAWHARPWQRRLANRDRHCLSTYPTDEAAFPFLLEYLYKFIGGCLY